jgi:phosphatidylinositol alpha-1,6-mannosyltransferase
MWIGVFPELSGIGGIQQVSRQMSAVLTEAAREQNLACELLGLNDARGRGSFEEAGHAYEFTGYARNKASLFLSLLRLMPRIERLYFGHVNLAPLAWLLRRFHPGIRYWVVAHGVEVWQPLPLFRRLALRGARGVFSVSADTSARMIAAQKLDSRKVRLLPPALDPAFVQAACDANVPALPARGRFLLTVGRLVSSEPGKGIDSVIRVLPELLKAVPDLFYLIVGEGDLRPELEKLASQSPARDRIFFLGELTPEQLKYCYSRCHIFVMPSRQEGFGVVFLEAMALAKPVVGACVGGIPEIVKNGVTGFLVVPGDLEMLALRISQLLTNEGLRNQMGEAGRKRGEENYSFEGYRAKLKAILNEIQ